jgi:hypothetical protein
MDEHGKSLPMVEYLQRIPWSIVVILCLTLGLAPFSPPHIVEKLHLLSQGKLVRPIDWFDLFFHAIPWLLLIAKAIVSVAVGKKM